MQLPLIFNEGMLFLILGFIIAGYYCLDKINSAGVYSEERQYYEYKLYRIQNRACAIFPSICTVIFMQWFGF